MPAICHKVSEVTKHATKKTEGKGKIYFMTTGSHVWPVTCLYTVPTGKIAKMS